MDKEDEVVAEEIVDGRGIESWKFKSGVDEYEFRFSGGYPQQSKNGGQWRDVGDSLVRSLVICLSRCLDEKNHLLKELAK